MFENIIKFFKKLTKKEIAKTTNKDVAKERLHLVLMQDRANVSADFLELMKQEIIEVIKKYIEVDDKAIDVRLTNQVNEDGTNGAPALYANIPIINMKNGGTTTTNKLESEEIVQKEEKSSEANEEVIVNEEDKSQNAETEQDLEVVIQDNEQEKKDNGLNEKQEDNGDNIENI